MTAAMLRAAGIDSATPPVIGAGVGIFDFDLPSELEAHEPPEARGLARDQVKIMVSNSAVPNVHGIDQSIDGNSALAGMSISHCRFADLPTFSMLETSSSSIPAEP